MNYVQPIRKTEQLEAMKNELLKSSYRDYLLFLCGVYLGRRISDLLALKVGDLRDKTVLKIVEQKTSKIIPLPINETLQNAVKSYSTNMSDNEYLFKSREGENKPITRIQAYRILSEAGKKCGISEIGTHTLRKTFGYHYYQKTHDIVMLQKIFGHSSPSITMRYIGIDDDLVIEAMSKFSYDVVL